MTVEWRLLHLHRDRTRPAAESAMPDQTSSRDHITEPPLLTTTEAAQLLRAPVATLRYWRHLGTGPHSFRVGRRVVYRRDDLQAWIDACRHHGTSTGT
jgi:excisionase family DNA binding protein